MNIHTDKPDFYHRRTRAAFLWSRILKTPLWAIYSLLPFIVFKDLNATPIQISVMVAIKPTMAIFSLYWAQAVNQRPDRLVSNIIWAGILGLIPFFFFPFANNPWYFVFAFGLFIMLHRGVIPAWMEIFKLNLPNVSRGRVFSYGTMLGYLGDGLLPFLFGWLLDGYFQSWRWIFPVAALISLPSLFLQYRISIRPHQAPPQKTPASSLRHIITRPWKDAWNLVKTKPDFSGFQLGFMLGGSGLMVIHAVLPAFFMGVLELSYSELAIALTLCKGIGVALTSPIWANWMNKVDIYRFSSVVTILACIFPLCLMLAPFHLSWLYLAYLFYGMMQAGSELSWHMSGPIFARDVDSTVYSSVNVVTVGLRGCVAPSFGTMILLWTNPSFVLTIGGLFCLAATLWLRGYNKELLKKNSYRCIYCKYE